MKIIQLIFLILSLKQIHAKLSIEVIANNVSDIKITYSGLDMKVVTSEEIKLFKIDNRNLYHALKKYYGKKPNNAYLKSPTPWGDLYKTYNWEQITRILTIKSARVKAIDMKPVILDSKDFENYSADKVLKINTGISQTIENSITTSWSETHDLTLSQEVEYDVNVIFAKLSGKTGISYTSSWGKTIEKSEAVTIGSTASIETELQPKQAVKSVLTATRGTLEVEVIYLASLRGNVAVNFKKPHNGHHFLGPHVEAVMKAGGLSNELETVQTIKVALYTDGSHKLYDKATGLPL